MRQKKVLWLPGTCCWLKSCRSQWLFYHIRMVKQKLLLGLSAGKMKQEVSLVTNDQINSQGLQLWKCISHRKDDPVLCEGEEDILP